LITGLFARSLFHLLASEKGFESSQVVAAEVDLSGVSYRAAQRKLVFDDAVLNSLRALPGVESAALVSAMPLDGETWIDGISRSDRPTNKPPLANFRWISPGYFETIRERLISGRLFDDRDATSKTIIISQASARAAWPNENPIGRAIRHDGKDYTVVGIVADARNNSLKLAPANMVYFHFHDDVPYSAVFLVQSKLAGTQLIPAVRRATWSRDASVVISRIKTLDSQLSDSLAPERFETAVLSGFGAAALFLAMLGVYGVLSYTVAVRRQEIGVRMALGATRENIYRLTMRDAFIPVAAGLASGWLLSLILARLVRSLLYGVRTIDTTVSLIVICLFLLAAAIAAFLPARRAASIDPMQALRTE
jgi:predicted permease